VLAGFLISEIRLDYTGARFLRAFYARHSFRVVPIYAGLLATVALLTFLATDARPVGMVLPLTITTNVAAVVLFCKTISVCLGQFGASQSSTILSPMAATSGGFSRRTSVAFR